MNDGGREFKLRDQNRELWLDFIDEPVDSERRLQRGTPIHQDYFITKNGKTVHVILLDVRYEYESKSLGDRLGEDQWQWLDLALKRGKERKLDLTMIGGGVQIIPERGMPAMLEDFKSVNRLRLFKILKENKMESVVFISGDVHSG